MTSSTFDTVAAGPNERSLLRVALKLDAVVTGANGAAYHLPTGRGSLPLR